MEQKKWGVARAVEGTPNGFSAKVILTGPLSKLQ